MRVRVDGCNECPLAKIDLEQISYCHILKKEKQDVDITDYYPKPIKDKTRPDECPLIQGEFKIQLKGF